MPYNNGNGNSNGRNYSQFDVNTNSLSVFSGNMCMRLDLYNKNLQVGLIRAVQTSEGRNTYPKDNAIRALLTPDRVQAVVTLITDGVIPALEARRPYEGSIITNSKMSTIVRVGCDADGNAYFDIYTGMDDRRIPKDAARYQFPKIRHCLGLIPERASMSRVLTSRVSSISLPVAWKTLSTILRWRQFIATGLWRTPTTVGS